MECFRIDESGYTGFNLLNPERAVGVGKMAAIEVIRPTARAAVGFCVFLLATLAGVSAAAEDSAWFAPEGCEFRVRFPAKPQITKQYIDGVGYYIKASGGHRGNQRTTYVVAAEGLPFDRSYIQGVDTAQFLLERAREYATFNGMSHVEYHTEKMKLGDVVTFRGGKTVGGVRALYMGKVILGKHSMLMLQGGGAAESFPQPGLLEFMASVQRK